MFLLSSALKGAGRWDSSPRVYGTWSEGRAACLCAGNSASGGRRGLVRHEEAQGTVRNCLGVDSRE